MSKQETKLEKQKKKETKKPKTKDEVVVKEMELRFPEEAKILRLLKDEGSDGVRAEKFLQVTGAKVLAKIDFKRGRIDLLDTEIDVTDRKRVMLAEEIIKRIQPALQKQFPKCVEMLLSEQEEGWLKKVIEMIDGGAETVVQRTRGRCVWVTFKKGRSQRSLLIE